MNVLESKTEQVFRRSQKYKSKWYELLEVYGENCVYCHIVPATEIDHVIPLSYIQYDGIENLRPCCSWCNLLASATVFDDFDAKYEWLRGKRSRKQKGNSRRTFCTDCRLPYQYPAHSPAMFQCPECYDIDNYTGFSERREWTNWIMLLGEADIDVRVYRDFGREMRSLRGTNLTARQKNDLFGTMASYYLANE